MIYPDQVSKIHASVALELWQDVTFLLKTFFVEDSPGGSTMVFS